LGQEEQQPVKIELGLLGVGVVICLERTDIVMNVMQVSVAE